MKKGDWKGAKSDDKDFIALQSDVGIANTASFITPSQNADGTWPLDMTGYKDIAIAIKPTMAELCYSCSNGASGC